MKPAEIRQLCDLYGEHAMSSSLVWRWVRLFSEGHKYVHDDFWSGWLSVVNEDLVRAFEEKIRDYRRFATTSLSLHFPQISWLLLHQIVSGKVKFRKWCANWVPKLLMEEHKLEQQATTLDFLTQYSEEGENFLKHVVTGNETWVSHEAPKSKQHSMEWRHTSSPTKTKFKQSLQLGRSCEQCFGTEKVFCLWTSCLKVPQSTQVSIATHFKNCTPWSRISDVSCLAGVLCWFMATPTLTLQCKISSRHFAGNNSIIPPWAQI